MKVLTEIRKPVLHNNNREVQIGGSSVTSTTPTGSARFVAESVVPSYIMTDGNSLILWSGVRDSNPCKSAWKADARPLGQPRASYILAAPGPQR